MAILRRPGGEIVSRPGISTWTLTAQLFIKHAMANRSFSNYLPYNKAVSTVS